MGSATWRILGAGSAVVAGLLAGKLVDAIWAKSGHDKAVDPGNPEVPLRQAVLYAALTGLVVGVTRAIATRKAAQLYARSSGHLPPPMAHEA